MPAIESACLFKQPLPQDSMIKNKFLKISNREEGITLIISIVLLAAVTFVSFSLSALIIREIVATRLFLRSEPALSAANAGGEVGLFRLQRGQGSLDISQGTLSQSAATYYLVSDLYDDPYLLTSDAVSCGDATEFWIPLIDAANWENRAANYGGITVKNTGECPFNFRVFSFGNPETILCNTATVSPDQQRTCGNLEGTDDRYILEIAPNGSANQIFKATITAKTNDLITSRGVPSESPTLRVTSKSGEVQRKIEIEIKR